MAADCSPDVPRVFTEPATAVAHAWVRADVYSELVYQAKLARLHPDRLTAQLLTAVLLLGEADSLLERARIVLES